MLIIRLVLKLTSKREVRQNETAVKVHGNQIRFIFNKYNAGRQINFGLPTLFDALEPKIISKTFKSNYVTFILKKRNPRKWPGLYANSKKPSQKKNIQQSQDFETRKDYLKNLKKFNSVGKSRERNNRYMYAEEDGFDKYTGMVPEEDRIEEERDEGSEGSNRMGSHRLIPSTKDISSKVNDILKGFEEYKYDSRPEDTTQATELGKTEAESFLQNEKMINGMYAKKNPKLYMKNGKKGKQRKRTATPEGKKGAKLYQNTRAGRKKGAKSSYKNRYMQKSQERQDRMNKRKNGKSANQKSYINKIKNGSGNLAPFGVSDRYSSNQEGKKNYFNSWLNKTEDSEQPGSGEFDERPENITKTGFKKTINNELMTIDEIIALEKKEAKQNSKLRRATEKRQKKSSKRTNKRGGKLPKSKSRPKAGRRAEVKDMGLDYNKYRTEVKKGPMYNEGTKSGASMHNNKKMAMGTFTTRKGEFNKIFDLHQNKEITSKQTPLEGIGHKEKSHQELQELKMSRKSVKNIEGLANALMEMESQKDLHKESFVENFPSNLPSKGDNQIQFGSRMVSRNNSEQDEIEIKSNLVSIKSELKSPKNVFFENEKPQTKSNIDLKKEQNVMERSKSRPIPKANGFYEKKIKKKSIRSKSTIRPGPRSRLAKTERGLSQNLSNLAPHTVVSYDGPNVSIVSQKLREKRGEILDTFAQLNLDMAWVHRQCRYIDLHSTQGVLKFFELQNRLIVKLATKLRKEKNSRFKVEKQCEKMMDNFKKDLSKK